MRATTLFLLVLSFLFSGCASIEVAKEVTKATDTVTTAIINAYETKQKEREEKIMIEKDEIIIEKKEEVKVVLKQKKISKINYNNKTLDELIIFLGEPQLIRSDGEITTIRFDSISCRVFFYFNSSKTNSQVEYYELRNSTGALVKNENKIKNCFSAIQKI